MEKDMKKLAIGLALLSTVALVGCGTVPTAGGSPPGTIGGIPASLGDTTVSEIQNGAAKACGFVPTVQTIQGIAASFFSSGALINSIVSKVEDSICAVVTKKSMSRGAARPMVNGVPVEGYFIR